MYMYVSLYMYISVHMYIPMCMYVLGSMLYMGQDKQLVGILRQALQTGADWLELSSHGPGPWFYPNLSYMNPMHDCTWLLCVCCCVCITVYVR